ncbi:MAG: alpha/beta hydrolase [Pedosphaera sp.]|nr:alpha/beta hydrolase [Pedosphaera sp.]
MPMIRIYWAASLFVTSWLSALGAATAGGAEAALRLDHTFRTGLVIESVGRAGRSTTFTDAIEEQLVSGHWSPPDARTVVMPPDGRERRWQPASADTNGWFKAATFRGGHAYFSFVSARPQIAILEASGHGMAYLNGEPHPGDPYRYGFVRVPVMLRVGTNDLLLMSARGDIRARLFEPTDSIYLETSDATLPDAVIHEALSSWAGVVLVNASNQWVSDLQIESILGGRGSRTLAPPMPPMSVRKVPVHLQTSAPRKAGEMPLQVRVARRGRSETSAATPVNLSIRVREAHQARKITFRSEIDGSVQYYALKPASSKMPGGERAALFLTLHGAGVEAIGQAEAYSPKSWGHIVAPTNRRPYGFDWEDWGRLDALEVLGLATAQLHPDPSRIYLTGHSMGGHGTWSLGATFPDRFAAIGPSAGWRSFWSYGGSDPYTNASPIERFLHRAAASSDTLGLSTNYLQQGIYILHGDADDNVPVREARAMRQHLAGFHRDVDWHEQKGAGHWWDNSDEPGAECVDWPPMFDFFSRHRLPESGSVRAVDFTTMNLAVSAWCHWVGIQAQIHSLQPSQVRVQFDPGQRRFRGTTINVASLALDVPRGSPHQTNILVELDGQPLHIHNLSGMSTRVWVERRADRWATCATPSLSEKGPQRAGPFREAFRHRVLFVFGTRGTPEENAWALAKARFDAETFWYRGNGSVDVVRDVDFDLKTFRDRGVILYGHRSMNAAWDSLMAASPVQVDRGQVRIGDRVLDRPDLAAVFLRPRLDSSMACVGVVAGSGPVGMRLTHRLPYFLSGAGFPDCLVVGPEMLREGTKGVVTAGFFNRDWSVGEEFAWHP